MTAQEILTKKLVGAYLSGFSVGRDWWDIQFEEYHIVAQNVISENEDSLSQLLNDKYPFNGEYIGKCAIVAAFMRREVIDVEINESCDLIIKFDAELKLTIPSDESIVDWQ